MIKAASAKFELDAVVPSYRQRHITTAVAVVFVLLASACSKGVSSSAPPKNLTTAESVDAVFKTGSGRFLVTDIRTLDDYNFQVSDGKLITPFNIVGTIRDFSYPTADCKGVEDKDSRYGKPLRFLFCKSKVAETVTGYTVKGDPISDDVKPGEWYYRFDFYSATGKSPAIQRIAVAGPFFTAQDAEVAHKAAISGRSQPEIAASAPEAAAAREAGPYLKQGALMCLTLPSFARGLVVRQWNNAPLPDDCMFSTNERTAVTNVRRSPHPQAALVTITETGATAFVDNDSVELEATEGSKFAITSTRSASSAPALAATNSTVTTEVPSNLPSAAVAAIAIAPEGQLPASLGAAPPAAEAGAETVRTFYSALGKGDGNKANSLMSLEKRAAPAYQPDAIEAFYGHMAEPLTLVSVSTVGSGDYEVRYRYRKQSAVCNGHAIVTTQESAGRTLIARVKPIGNC